MPQLLMHNKGANLKAKLARRAAGGVWDSSKRCIFRIKIPLACAAARVVVCGRLFPSQWLNFFHVL
jgi:hypothetical protein